MKGALEIWKFGGASLADEHGMRRAVDYIGSHRGPLVIVASALAGVTDLLLTAAQQSANGEPAAAGRAAETFRVRHHTVARAVAKGQQRDRLQEQIDKAAREYADLCNALGMFGHLEPRAQDLLVSRGERMSTALLAAAIGASRAEYVDAADVIATESNRTEMPRRSWAPLRNARVSGCCPSSKPAWCLSCPASSAAVLTRV